MPAGPAASSLTLPLRSKNQLSDGRVRAAALVGSALAWGTGLGAPWGAHSSEGTLPPQDATMGRHSSALVDEHETIFKKNPRRVVRPAGESCMDAGVFGC